MKTKPDRLLNESMNKDPRSWKGILYSNINDSRVFVPKRNPAMGWTLNFANPLSYLILLAIIMILIFISYLF